MILHYYSPSVPESYFHSGRGLGSAFARIFSKIASKTASKVASTAAKNAGKKLVKVVTTKGMEIGKKALDTAAKESLKAVKKHGPKALMEAGKFATDFAAQKIDAASHNAIKHGVPAGVVHSLSNAAKTGLNKTENRLTAAIAKEVNTLYQEKKQNHPRNRSVPKKKLAGVKRKAPRLSRPAKKRITNNLSNIIEEA